ncbi:NADP-dependent oxidoreductase domain-containing protein [Cokeromyces recurvatus]|uniref:NADP-dependent oxidoreductase domain-containing protein n=1 Tax=Cokeromyces recurvatus TaxID=90255 RepID=UPI00221EAA07|nr:NADP-dependent oxidoreductase domain-containing protein [Cokeromyces recurvatus]KAI7908221.1 NADP-dependent oxidoreductase domain-containing protein [Cokeromyces recurvatus]
MTSRQLYNGDNIPILGLGTYRMRTYEELRPVVFEAIRSGYRLIDSATVYKNEEILGKILKEVFADPDLNVKRSDLFITSKLSPRDQGYDACYAAVNESLRKFDLDYLDLYLIHWPGTSKRQLSDPINKENRTGSYKALEQLYKEGKLKHIGVSNYTAQHLKHLLSVCTIVPHVHQFELHPCLYQPEILDICKENNIQIQAYSSLGEGALINGTIKMDCLKTIAENHHVSMALVLLRWAVEHEWIIIPKSKTRIRVQENAKVFSFKLSENDMNILDNIHHIMPRRFCWDPTDIY